MPRPTSRSGSRPTRKLELDLGRVRARLEAQPRQGIARRGRAWITRWATGFVIRHPNCGGRGLFLRRNAKRPRTRAETRGDRPTLEVDSRASGPGKRRVDA